MRFLLVLICLSATGGRVDAQQQVRLCFNVSGNFFCQNVTASNKLPIGAGTGGAVTTGTAHLVKICYAIPNSPFCQDVDATHPLPIQ